MHAESAKVFGLATLIMGNFVRAESAKVFRPATLIFAKPRLLFLLWLYQELCYMGSIIG